MEASGFAGGDSLDAFVRDDGSGNRRFMDGDILGLGQRVTRIVHQRFKKGERPIVHAPDGLRQRLAMVRRQLVPQITIVRPPRPRFSQILVGLPIFPSKLLGVLPS